MSQALLGFVAVVGMPVYNRLTSGLPEQVMTEKTADKIHNRDNQIFFTSKGKTITGWIGVQDLPV